MSQRFTLFYAGFTAHAPALYFSQLQFIDTCVVEEDKQVAVYISKFSDTLKDKIPENLTHLKTAISVARHLDIEILPQPSTHEEYFNWLSHYTGCFEAEFPMARIDHYYFLFARKIAEILCNLGLLKTYLDFTTTVPETLDLTRKIEKCLKDTEFILFKLMAAAALLSSEPRQNYFNVFYRSLCQEFLPFKGINISALNGSELVKLNAALQEYDLVVMDGFKKCIGLLKELGI